MSQTPNPFAFLIGSNSQLSYSINNLYSSESNRDELVPIEAAQPTRFDTAPRRACGHHICVTYVLECPSPAAGRVNDGQRSC